MLPEYMLSDLPAGRSADVAQMDAPGPMGRRLLDIGFTEGTRVQCLYAAPSGEPRAYLVRGTVTALRGKDAAEIKVREEDGACNMRSAARCNSGAENKEG